MPRFNLFALKNRERTPSSNRTSSQAQNDPKYQPDVQKLSNDKSQPSQRSSHSAVNHLDCSQTVNQCVVTPDGRFVAVATDSPAQKQFQSHPSGSMNTNPHHSAVVYELCSTNALKILSYATQPLESLTCTSTALTSDATVCITGTQSKGAYVWDATTAKISSNLEHRAVVRDVDISSLGNLAITACSDGVVRVWDVELKKVITPFRTHRRPVNACVFTASEKRIVSAGLDCAVCIWDRRSGADEFVFKWHRNYVTDVSAHMDGSIIASVGLDARLVVYDIRNNKRPLVDHNLLHPAYCCAMTPDVTRIVVGGDHLMLRAYNLCVGSELDLVFGSEQNTLGDPERIRSCSISDDGCKVLAACARSLVQAWELDGPPIAIEGNDFALQTGCGDEGCELVVVPFRGQALIRSEDSQIEIVFMEYMNHGRTMKARDVARALIHDSELGRLVHIWQVYVAHLVLKTMRGAGERFSPLDVGGAVQLDSFLFEKVYHRLSQLAPSRSEQQLAREILQDAAKAGFISREQRFMIIGDMRTIEHVDTKLDRIETIMVKVYGNVSSKLHKLEDRVSSITNELKNLDIQLKETNERMDRAAKIQRYANLVKLGMALVPFAGTIGMAFVDETASLVLSMDLHSITDFFLELFPVFGHHATDSFVNEEVGILPSSSRHAGTDSGERQFASDQTCSAVLVQILLSSQLHERLSTQNKQQLHQITNRVFGGDSIHARYVVSQIVNENDVPNIIG